MKTHYSFILLLIIAFSHITGFTQITINNNDMPVPNDTFRISTTINIHSLDPAVAGANASWDFSILTSNTQTIDTFFSVLSSYIPVTYNLAYNNFLDPIHKATVATRNFNTSSPFPQVQISETFNFFKSSSSGYVQVGQGAKINGLPTTMKYDVPETFFTFPMQLGNIDSSTSKYGNTIPSLGYYGQTIHRINTVDAYGSLTTPYGTFDVMRVKSLIYKQDTMYIDTILQYGTTINRPLETQYIWLGDNQGEPLLQISKINNQFTIRYKDSIFSTSITPEFIFHKSLFAFPVPAKDNIRIISEESFHHLLIIDILGKNVKTVLNGFNFIDISDLQKGIYFIHMFDTKNQLISSQKIIKE